MAVDITDPISSKLRQAGVRDGICLVYVPHTTVGIIINEGADPSVMEDVVRTLDRLIPWKADYKHAEGNSAAHVKSILTGNSVQLIIDSGKLVLGTWQRVFLIEFDGPRTRTIFLKFQSCSV